MYFSVKINQKSYLMDSDVSPVLTLQDILQIAASELVHQKWVNRPSRVLGTAPIVVQNGKPWERDIPLAEGLEITVIANSVISLDTFFAAVDLDAGKFRDL